MGRLVDIDRLCNDLVKRWSIADKKKEDTIRAVDEIDSRIEEMLKGVNA